MTQHNIREYINIENDLRLLLNSKGKKGFNKTDKFLFLIREMKNLKEKNGIKGFQISKQFLKNLYNSDNKKNRSNKLNYLLKNVNKEILKQNFYFKEIIFKKFQTTATSYNIVYRNNYIKKFRVGKVYTIKNQKTFDFLVFEIDKIKQIQQNKKDMLLRSLNLYPLFVLGYFFNLIE